MSEPTKEEREWAMRSILMKREREKRYRQSHKEKRAVYDQQHYLDTIETKTEYVRQYGEEHREQKAEYMRGYFEEHKEEKAEYERKYYEEHREEVAEYMRQWRQEHAEECAEHARQYHKEHPEVSRNNVRKRRALKASSDGNFTDEEFQLLCEVFENRCVYCHKELPLTADHMIPLSKGGSDSIENIVPACQSCNSSKGTKAYDDFIKQLVKE